MSSFTKPLKLEYIDGNDWLLIEEFEYYTDVLDKRYHIKVPKLFKTNFASIPKILQWIFSPADKRYGKAAVVHDYLYSTGLFPREVCDKIFLEAMGVLGAPFYIKYLFYITVRLFGKNHYIKIKGE